MGHPIFKTSFVLILYHNFTSLVRYIIVISIYLPTPILAISKYCFINYLGGGPVIRAWDQEVCSLCGLRFEPCGCSYDGHWRLIWSLTSGPVGLVEVCTSWPGYEAVFFF
jgi:hypothetical protein